MADATETVAPKATKETKAAAKADDAVFSAAEDFTAAAQDQFRKFTDTITGNANDLRAQTETVSEEMRVRFEKAQKQVADVNAELVEAARTEVSEAVQFANDLVTAKTFADALNVQQTYWTNLFQNRVERTRELTQNSVDVARDTIAPVNTSFGSMFDQSKMFDAFFPSKA